MRNTAVQFAIIGLACVGHKLAAAPPIRLSDSSETTYVGPTSSIDYARPIATGDLDGDGFDEVIIGASRATGGLISRVFVIRGSTDATARGVVDLATQPPSQVILGATVDDNLGSSIATGDVTGDGLDDLLLCASNASFGARTRSGLAYLIHGGASFFASPTRNLAQAGTWNVRFAGPTAGGDMGGRNAFGGLDTQACAIGNLNNDAFGDLVFGVHLANGGATESGRVVVRMGAPFFNGTTIDLSISVVGIVVVNGDGQFDELGDAVATGDITGDGIDELIIPNGYFSQTLFDSEGAVHIYRGRTAWPSSFSLASSPADITLLGNRGYDALGESAAIGDFDNDGIADLIAAAPGGELGAFTNQIGDGLIYGMRGRTAWQTGTHLIDFASATPDFMLVGDPQKELGSSLAIGDINGDGYADVLAGEWFGGPINNGVVEVLLGRAIAGSPTFFASIDTDLRIEGSVAQDRISFALAGGDSDGDARDEIIIGAPFNSGGRGTVYVARVRYGDIDLDDDVDASDAATILDCLHGPDVPVGYECLPADANADQDVDVADIAALQRAATAP